MYWLIVGFLDLNFAYLWQKLPYCPSCLMLPHTTSYSFQAASYSFTNIICCLILPQIYFIHILWPHNKTYCPILSGTASCCLLLSHAVFYYLLLSSTASSCLVLPQAVLYCLLLPYTASYSCLLPQGVLYCLMLSCTASDCF